MKQPGCFQRRFIASVLAVSLLAGGIVSAEAGSLPPGKPAGVKEAQLDRATVAVVGAAILLVAGFSVLIAGGQNDNLADTVIAGGSGASALVNKNVTTTTVTGTH
jgi:tetrahydromethanopterin S-methyltransferase subunit C